MRRACLLASLGLAACFDSGEPDPPGEPPPSFDSIRVIPHLCVAYSGDTARGCAAFAADSARQRGWLADRRDYFDFMQAWKSPGGETLQLPPRDLTAVPEDSITYVTRSGGALLGMEALYRSPTWRSDSLFAMVNLMWIPLTNGIDYGYRAGPDSASTWVRAPLTFLAYYRSEAREQRAMGGGLISFFSAGGGGIAFEGRRGDTAASIKRLMYYDPYGPVVNPLHQWFDSAGAPHDSLPELNGGTFDYRGAEEAKGRRGIAAKGLLVGFDVNGDLQLHENDPDPLRVELFRTEPGDKRAEAPWKSYPLDTASLHEPIWNPYDSAVAAGRVYLASIPSQPGLTIKRQEVFFWISPDDLRTESGSLEGVKFLLFVPTAKPPHPDVRGNASPYGTEFRIDNAGP